MVMATKLTKVTHKIAIQLHVVAAVPFAVLSPGSQSGNFWIHPCITQRINPEGQHINFHLGENIKSETEA
jgi:hypothetical protein